MTTLILEKLAMHGYGYYVWGAYGISFCLMLVLILFAHASGANE